MAGTFSSIYLQVVFGVKGRQCLINRRWQPELNKYVAGIIKGKGQTSLIVNGMADHIHMLFELKPVMAISDLVRDIKNNSSRFINENRMVAGKFSWQTGCGVFSYSRSHIDYVYNYILKQEEHHRVKSFKEEYVHFLKMADVHFEEKYLL